MELYPRFNVDGFLWARDEQLQPSWMDTKGNGKHLLPKWVWSGGWKTACRGPSACAGGLPHGERLPEGTITDIHSPAWE